MTSYENLENLPVGDFIGSRDEPIVVGPETTIDETRSFIKRSPQKAVVVWDVENPEEYEVVTKSDLEIANQGGSPVRGDESIGVFVRGVATAHASAMPAHALISEVPAKLSDSAEHVIVTNSLNQPKGLIERSELASRVRDLT